MAVGLGGAAWNVTRDDAGQITGKTETVNGVDTTYAYTYDIMGRLLTVTKNGTLDEEYTCDAQGRRTSEYNVSRGITTARTYTYDDEDRLLTAGSASYTHDVDGFLTSKVVGNNTTAYSYSTTGELRTVTLPDDTVIEYLHDAVGRRVAKKVNGAIVEKYLWAGRTNLLAVYDGSNNLLIRFEGSKMVKNGSTYYLTTDQVGSFRAVIDSVGNIVKQIVYDSFGNILTDTNPTFTIPLGFASGLHDRDTNLVLFGYRDYDPDTGRWTAKDPIGFAGGDTNVYTYVSNNSVDYNDLLGLKFKVINPKDQGDFDIAKDYLSKTPTMKPVIDKLEKSKRIYYIDTTGYPKEREHYSPDSRTIYWDSHAGFKTTCGDALSPALALGHEMAHAASKKKKQQTLLRQWDEQYENKEERRVIEDYEVPTAEYLGEGVRTNHKVFVHNVPTPLSH